MSLEGAITVGMHLEALICRKPCFGTRFQIPASISKTNLIDVTKTQTLVGHVYNHQVC